MSEEQLEGFLETVIKRLWFVKNAADIHATERGLLHLMSAPCVYILALYLSLALGQHGFMRHLLATLVILVIVSSWEIYNTWQGQPLKKAFTDLLSWTIGCTVSALMLIGLVEAGF